MAKLASSRNPRRAIRLYCYAAKLALLPLTLADPVAAHAQPTIAAPAVVLEGQGVSRIRRPAERIISGPLGLTLSAYAARNGINLSFDPQVTADLKSTAVDVSGSPLAVMAQMVVGTGLSLQKRADGSYTLTKPSSPTPASERGADSVQVLPPIYVTASGEPARGPVIGYVARQSTVANKTDTDLMATSQSVSVITRNQMSDQAVKTVSDALKYTAGVNADPYGADTRADWFYIRGFNADVYWDGLCVPQIANRVGSYAAFRVDPSSLERVEVLRGPSSVLYGGGNLGGFVNLVSKEPSTEVFHEIALEYGSYNRHQLRVDTSGPVNADGTLLYRINALGRLSNAQVENVTDNRLNLNPSITWRPNARTHLTVSATYMLDDMGSAVSYAPMIGMVTPSRYGRIARDLLTGDPAFDRYKKQEAAVGYRFEHRINDALTFRQNLRFSHLDLDYRSVYGTALLSDQHTYRRTAYRAHPILNGIQLDNNVEYDASTGPIEHTVVAGIDVQQQNFQNRLWTTTASSLDLYAPKYGTTPTLPTNATTSTDQEQRQLGLYLQDQLRWQNWVLAMGGRQDFTDSTTNNHLTGKTTDQNPHKFTYRFGLLYESHIGISPYVSYSTSFLPTLSTNLAGNALQPTTGQQYEAGIKYQPPGMKALFTASVFDLTQQNVSTTDPANTANTLQTGEIRSRGVELEAKMSLTSRLNMVASFTAQNPVVTRSNSTDFGKRPYGVPRQMAAAWMDYTLPMFADVKLGFGGGIRYIGSTAGDTANSFKVGSITLVDALIHADIGKRWRAQINATNLFNRWYVAGCNSTAQCYYGSGRVVVGSLSRRW